MTWRGDSRPPTAHRSASCWCHSAGSDECRCLKAAVPSSIEAGLKLSGSGRWAKNERKNHRNGKRTKRALPSRKCGNRQWQHMSKAPNSGPFWNLLVPRARKTRLKTCLQRPALRCQNQSPSIPGESGGLLPKSLAIRACFCEAEVPGQPSQFRVRSPRNR